MAYLARQPQFTQLRQVLQNNPTLLQPILQQIGQSNPRLLQVRFLFRTSLIPVAIHTDYQSESGSISPVIKQS